MTKKNVVVFTVEEHPEFTLEELMHAANVTQPFIQELIDHGILEPQGHTTTTWRFTTHHLQRIRTTRHLQNDLEINLAGAALVLDLLEEMKHMRAQIELFEKHLKY